MSNTNKRVRKREFKCKICGDSHCREVKFGDRVGDGSILARHIAEHNGSDVKNYKAKHLLGFKMRWTDKNGKEKNDYQLAAHHLICSEAMDDEDQGPNCWMNLCHNFGYDINSFENGVFLPSNMESACANRVPLHLGDHEATFGDGANNYVQSVINLIKPIKNKASNYCKNPEDFKKELDDISADIFGYIKSFQWTITADGRDYQGVIGCMNCETIVNKRYKIYKEFNKTEKEVDKMVTDRGALAFQMKVSASARTLQIFCDQSKHKRLLTPYPLAISK